MPAFRCDIANRRRVWEHHLPEVLMVEVGVLNKEVLNQAIRDSEFFKDDRFEDNPYISGAKLQNKGPIDRKFYNENLALDVINSATVIENGVGSGKNMMILHLATPTNNEYINLCPKNFRGTHIHSTPYNGTFNSRYLHNIIQINNNQFYSSNLSNSSSINQTNFNMVEIAGKIIVGMKGMVRIEDIITITVTTIIILIKEIIKIILSITNTRMILEGEEEIPET
ncbi:hypothetical protein DFH28DRAFT_1165486 [Melampsora americana]|nr:hypothetical protein DFH28DRAFT_1165486 [Melampsora americana]